MWRLFKKKEKEGFALIMTIIIVAAAFAVIAFALSALQKSALSTVVNHTKSMQAYYLARSGAAAVAKWIIDNPDKVSEIINETSASTSLKDGMVGTVQVSVEASPTANGTVLTIISTGTVGVDKNKAIETLRLTLVRKNQESGFNFDKAIIALGSLGIGGNSNITGDIEYQGTKSPTIWGNVKVKGKVFSNVPLNKQGNVKITGGVVKNSTPTAIPSPLPPSNLEHKEDISLWGNNYKEISEDGSYSHIKMLGNNNLIISTGGKTLTLFVDDFEIGGNSKIYLKGGGTLRLFVNKFDEQGNLFPESDSDSANILIYSNRSNSIKITGNSGFHFGKNYIPSLYIYAPDSDFSLTGNAEITGGIVAKNVNIMGNSTLKRVFIPFRVEGSGGESETYAVGSWWY